MDQVQVLRVLPVTGVAEQFWNKWCCMAKAGSDHLRYLQRSGDWSDAAFYFDSEHDAKSTLMRYHPSAVVLQPEPKPETRQPEPEPEPRRREEEEDSSSSDDSSSLSLGGLLGGDSGGFTGGGGDFGGGGAGGDW